MRLVLASLLVDHALFGCVLLGQRILTSFTRNDDLSQRRWPHVLCWINSLE